MQRPTPGRGSEPGGRDMRLSSLQPSSHTEAQPWIRTTLDTNNQWKTMVCGKRHSSNPHSRKDKTVSVTHAQVHTEAVSQSWSISSHSLAPCSLWPPVTKPRTSSILRLGVQELGQTFQQRVSPKSINFFAYNLVPQDRSWQLWFRANPVFRGLSLEEGACWGMWSLIWNTAFGHLASCKLSATFVVQSHTFLSGVSFWVYVKHWQVGRDSTVNGH